MAAARHGKARFPTTRWSWVDVIRRGDARARQEVLDELLARYLPALQAHLVQGRGVSTHDAEDLIQEFVAAKVLERDLIAQADRELGKFRTFLLKALDRFLIDWLRQAGAKKRSPAGAALQTIGDREEFFQPVEKPSDAFDVAWARGVVAEALRRMRRQCETTGRKDLWGIFECRLANPILEGTQPVDYQTLVQRFDLKSPAQASNMLITAKRMYARALRSVVAEYVRDDDEMESEIDELREILAKRGKEQ